MNSELQLNPIQIQTEKATRAVKVAGELLRQGPDWVTFFREILGVDGVVQRLFPTEQDLRGFEQTEEYAEIQKMLSNLRKCNRGDSTQPEPTRVITVRLPKSLHESLRAEAHDRRTTLNKLCISKLLQVIDEEVTAEDLDQFDEIRSRKPR